MSIPIVNEQLEAAAQYIALGWKLFVVNAGKGPLNNCPRCQPGAGCPGQDRCVCGGISCHGFWAATDNLDHLRALLWRVGDGALALRTGTASGVFAVDAEGSDDDEAGYTGLEVVDDIERWTDGVSLPSTLRALTSGGGAHLFYRMPPAGMPGRNRILPNVDLKADGGYVVLPPAAGRRWVNWGDRLEEPGDALTAWLSPRLPGAANGTGKGAGILSSLRNSAVIPSGFRYEFTRDLVYHLRRSGTDYDEALRLCRAYWERYAQPPDAKWAMPWNKVTYELDRVWARVEPEQRLSFARQAWTDRMRKGTN